MDSSISSEQGSGSPKRLTLGILMSISSFMAILAKRASQASSKLKPAPETKRRRRSNLQTLQHGCDSPKLPPRSPLARPKELLTQISSKAIAFAHGNSNKKRFDEEPEDFGDGGVWQRTILMGYKCQPLDFSGVIYYDSAGKQLKEVPLRSPRASPLPGYLTRGK